MSLKIMHMLSSSHVGGAEQVCLDLARHQKAEGHQVFIASLKTGDVGAIAHRYNIEFTHANQGTTDSKSKFSRWRAEATAFEQCVSQVRPQLVHSHVPKTHLLCNRIMPRLGIPWLATMHGSWKQFAYAPQTENRPWLRPYLLARHALGDLISLRSAARVVCVADYVKRGLEKIGVSSARMVSILNGLEWSGDIAPRDSARPAFGIQPDVMVIGAMGYFAPVKGFDILIGAFSELLPRYPYLRLYIAGGNVLGCEATQRKLEKLISQFDLSDKVFLPGRLDPRAGFLSAIDIFVVSSRTEGLPLVLVEAMHHGVPSVVTSAGGCLEAARPNMESLVFKSGSVCSLVEALEKLITDSGLRQSLGEAAAARASGYLTLSRCAAEYETVYQDVLSPKDRRNP